MLLLELQDVLSGMPGSESTAMRHLRQMRFHLLPMHTYLGILVLLLALLVACRALIHDTDHMISLPESPSRLEIAAPAPLLPHGQTGQWRLLFHDEFDGDSLDHGIWHTCFVWWQEVCSLLPNHELQLYNAADVLIEHGLLRLRARRRLMGEWEGKTYEYSSGMVSTGGIKAVDQRPRFAFQYGYVEIRAKTPYGQGFWPAFWLLPASYAPLSRPEIDIMEILGHTPHMVYMHLHWWHPDGSPGSAGQSWTGANFSAAWHIFGLYWSPQAVMWYVDGIERWRYTDTANIPTEPMYLILNLAVGGTWPGPPDDHTAFPSYFEVDYVRVWQKPEE